MRIPFNRAFTTGREFDYIRQAVQNAHISGDGVFTEKCHGWLEKTTGCGKALLTHSATAALEMSAILCGIGSGDEVIMPSYTFVSTANAFVMRGGVPVFVDIRPDTLNIDETKIETAVTSRTKAIVVVHYAGVACEMDAIMEIARRHKLIVIEDAAQAIMSSYRGRPLGSFGHMAAVSFHETKNLTSGEGGALLMNDERFVKRAGVIREKGTNRAQFFKGEVDKYSWVDIGSSYLPSDIIAAFLWAQLEDADSITQKRLHLWERYYQELSGLESKNFLRRPSIPGHCGHNAHMFHILTESAAARKALLEYLNARGIGAIFHYVPLHSSPAGLIYARTSGALPVTDDASSRVVRLPLWVGLGSPGVRDVTGAIKEFYSTQSKDLPLASPALKL